MHSGVVMDDTLDQPWDRDAPALGAGHGWGGSTQEAFVSFPDGAYVRSRFARGTTVWTRAITSIRTDASHPIQRAWIDVDVPQCGYCQSGQIMSAAALLARKANPSDADIDQAMRGNLCRCGTYSAIREAIHRASRYATSASKVGSGGAK